MIKLIVTFVLAVGLMWGQASQLPAAAGGGGTTYTGSDGVVVAGTVITSDSTVVPRYFTGAGAPAIACTQGRDFYLKTGAPVALYQCPATNTWAAVGSTTEYLRGTTSGTGIASGGTTRYHGPGLTSAGGTDPDYYSFMISRAGTVAGFRAYMGTAQPAGGACTLTVYINGVTSGITGDHAASAAEGEVTASGTAAVVAGDRVSMRVINNGSATGCFLGAFAIEVQ